jgi:hypothetical protein
MGKKSSPSAPDYRGAAEQQGESAERIATQTTTANRPNQYTPWGSSEWTSSRGVDPATGEPVTNWTQNINLTPAQQAALEDQQDIQAGRSDLALGLIDQTASEIQDPFAWDSFTDYGAGPELQNADINSLSGFGDTSMQTGRSALPEGTPNYNELRSFGEQPDSAYNPDFAQTQFDRNMSLIGPRLERAQASLDTQLRNQGLRPGSEAYDNAMQDLRDQQGEQIGRISADAVNTGNQEQQRAFERDLSAGNFANALRSQQFGEMQNLRTVGNALDEADFQRAMDVSRLQDEQRNQLAGQQLAYGQQNFGQQMAQSSYQNSLRQQQISEEAMRRGISINEMNALLNGQQVQNPNMPNFMSATQAEPTQYLQAAMAQGNFDLTRQGNAISALNGVGDLASSAATAYAAA